MNSTEDSKENNREEETVTSEAKTKPEEESALFKDEPDIPEEEAKEYEEEKVVGSGQKVVGEKTEETKEEEPQTSNPKPQTPEPKEPEEEEETEEPEDDRGIYAIRTTANKEKNVASKLYDRIMRDGYDISAIVVPGLKGYLLVEGSRKDIDKAYRGVTHARGLVSGKTGLDEISHFLAPKPAVTTLAVDYIVEVSAGPFKGEKAKITRVDNTKNEITIELLEATVPIPITVPAESVRVLEKDLDDKKAKAAKEAEENEPETEDPFAL